MQEGKAARINMMPGDHAQTGESLSTGGLDRLLEQQLKKRALELILLASHAAPEWPTLGTLHSLPVKWHTATRS